MKSTDPDEIFNLANKYYEQKKYAKAITLYDRMKPYVNGTDTGVEVLHKLCWSHYYDKNYRTAGYLFNQFHDVYPKDPRAKEMLYMSAVCYYKISPEYNLDQESTKKAIEELQKFIDRYPDSEKVAESNLLIAQLQKKLEKKAFENAMTLFKTMQYKASSFAFMQVLDEFPDTDLKEDILYYNFKSKYLLAKNSLFKLKTDRYKEAQTAVKIFLQNFPNSSKVKEANETIDRIKVELEEHLKLEQALANEKNSKNIPVQ